MTETPQKKRLRKIYHNEESDANLNQTQQLITIAQLPSEILYNILSNLDDISLWCCILIESHSWNQNALNILGKRLGNTRILDCSRYSSFELTRLLNCLTNSTSIFKHHITTIRLQQRPSRFLIKDNHSGYTKFSTFYKPDIDHLEAVFSFKQQMKISRLIISYKFISLTLSDINTSEQIVELLNHHIDDRIAIYNDSINHADDIKSLSDFTPPANLSNSTRTNKALTQIISKLYNNIERLIKQIGVSYNIFGMELDRGINLKVVNSLQQFFPQLHKLQLILFNCTSVNLSEFLTELTDNCVSLESFSLLIDTSECINIDSVLSLLLFKRRNTLRTLRLVNWTFGNDSNIITTVCEHLRKLEHLDIRFCHGAIGQNVRKICLSALQTFTFSIYSCELDIIFLQNIFCSINLTSITEIYSNPVFTDGIFNVIYQRFGYTSIGKGIKSLQYFNLIVYYNEWNRK
jgi:hypothetical protein